MVATAEGQAVVGVAVADDEGTEAFGVAATYVVAGGVGKVVNTSHGGRDGTRSTAIGDAVVVAFKAPVKLCWFEEALVRERHVFALHDDGGRKGVERGGRTGYDGEGARLGIGCAVGRSHGQRDGLFASGAIGGSHVARVGRRYIGTRHRPAVGAPGGLVLSQEADALAAFSGFFAEVEIGCGCGCCRYGDVLRNGASIFTRNIGHL